MDLDAARIELIGGAGGAQTHRGRLTHESEMRVAGNGNNGSVAIADSDSRRRKEAAIGEAFDQAYLSCVYDRATVAVAESLAMLEESATMPRIARLTGLELVKVEQAIRTLEAGGLLAGHRFKVSTARAAVLNGMAAEACATLHSLVAAVLHHDGAPVDAVAKHLLAAGDVTPSWAVSVLHEAAARSLAGGDLDRAFSLLRLALRGDSTAHEHANTLALLSSAHWRVNPSVVVRYFPELTASARAGHIKGSMAIDLVSWLAWFGMAEDADDLLAHLRRSAPPGDPTSAAEIRRGQLGLGYLYPALYRGQRQPGADDGSEPDLRAASLLVAALHGQAGEALAAAGRTLPEYRLDDQTWPTIRSLITALVYADRLTSAAACCEAFIDRAKDQRALVWEAVLTCLYAEVALRRGDPATAAHRAEAALSLMSPESWGVVLGYPAALLIRAYTAMGRPEEGLRHLRLPVPNTMFRTVVGLQYLRARGYYHHAAGRYDAALSDFRDCGTFMRRWGIDLPVLVPWRTDTARTLLEIGRVHEAAELADVQLRQLPPGAGRARVASLRILTAARQRPRRTASTQAPRTESTQKAGGLTEAEHRVAVLATQGMTNRQIAAYLHLTASTVEQHLTRCYRKLRVRRRADLPVALQVDHDHTSLVTAR